MVQRDIQRERMMGSVRRILFDYAKLMRVSNLPTCLANVLTGAAIGMQFQQPSIFKIVSLVIVICCYYCGGMILNDLCDIKYDKAHRSNRPLVTGEVSFRSAMIVTAVLFILATVILFIIAPHALPSASVLLIFIVIYDFRHKKHSSSIVYMAACRSLVYIICTIAVAYPSQSSDAFTASFPFAIIIGFYTLVITIVARMENSFRIDWRKWLSIAMPLALYAILFFVRPSRPVYAVIAAMGLGYWMLTACRFVFVKPPRIKHAVLTWLSGMCLVDAWFLTVLDQPMLAIIAGVCFIITVYGHKRISGT
ncbi:MAG: UbiA family prenyltransferase [Phycisphaerae bacterium]|nr:UbiA family prenyltransferase [Phycisphaerae bacterium]